MLAATKAVIEVGMSVRQAADLHQVPKGTLGDRVSGRVLLGARSGPRTYLSSEEEEELVIFLPRGRPRGAVNKRKRHGTYHSNI